MATAGCVTCEIGTSTLTLTNNCAYSVDVYYGSSMYYLTSGQTNRNVTRLSSTETLTVYNHSTGAFVGSTTISGTGGGGTVDPDPWPPDPDDPWYRPLLQDISARDAYYQNGTLYFYLDFSIYNRNSNYEDIRIFWRSSANGTNHYVPGPNWNNNASVRPGYTTLSSGLISWDIGNVQGSGNKSHTVTVYIDFIYYDEYNNNTETGFIAYNVTVYFNISKEFTWAEGRTRLNQNDEISRYITADKWNELAEKAGASMRATRGADITAAIYNNLANRLGVSQVQPGWEITADHFNNLRDAYLN